MPTDRRRGFSPPEVDEMELWQIARFLSPPIPKGPGGAVRMTRAQHAAQSRELIRARVAQAEAMERARKAGASPDAAAGTITTPTMQSMVASEEQVAALRARRADIEKRKGG